jgi:hypothetical protein
MEKIKSGKRRIEFCILQTDYNRLMERWKSTTCRTLSQYIRDTLNQEPVYIKYRNQSADDFLEIAIGIKNDLEAIIQRLQGTCHPVALIEEKVDGIKLTMDNIYELWFSKQ